MSYPFDAVRSAHRSLDPASALEERTSILLGVSQPAASALAAIDISTVFDLASSEVFANAVDICLLAESGAGRFASTGKVPTDALREGHATPIAELPSQPISLLGTHSPKTELDALAAAIDITSIRDLAAWPPYRAAREFLDRVYNPLAMTGGADRESPADLVPGNGQYPTERVQYKVLLFDQFVGGRRRLLLAPEQLGSDGPLDVSNLLATDEGYESPAVGGVLTFTQSWYTKGLALGNLIHGVALAPGESTKIAVIDWSRRTRSNATEAIDETELLGSTLSRARAINEITSAVADETQRGDSGATSFTTATQRGESEGSAGLAADPHPGVTTSGSSFGTSTARTNATAWSTSSGHREVGASLSQDIVDRTQQASHSARNRRASIVREVSQEESESISTRTLTNYNHMHALTVEYYEVVQLYRTVVELSKADRCLFVPMKLIDFAQPRVVDRYRQVIAANGLRGDVQALSIAEPGRVALWAPQRVGPWSVALLKYANELLGTNIGAPTDPVLAFPANTPLNEILFEGDTPFSSLVGTLWSGETVEVPLAVDPAPPFQDGAALQWGGKLHKTGSLHSLLFGVLLGEVRRVEARKRSDSAGFSGRVVVKMWGRSDGPPFGDGFHFPSWTVDVEAASPRALLFEQQPTVATKQLVEHLQENRLYYSQAIWDALDPATIGILLSGYTWTVGGRDRPLVELLDPTPVAIVANYLVFRISGDDARDHAAWLTRNNIILRQRREDLVPVPSGGVFAEAVLGRFNSAEKLDITRFWNWQDSPIPIQAPDIAAIQAGSRRDADNTVPGQLASPVLNIVNAPALPDPQGMGSVLAAIQNGGMFRDMSGLAATIGLAQAGLAGAQQGATDAAAQAGQNAAVAAQLGAKVAELAAKVVAAYFTGGASLAAGAGVEGIAGLAGGISGQGAKINQGKDMDRRGIPRQKGAPRAPGFDGLTPGNGGNGTAMGSSTEALQAGSNGAGTWEGDATSTALGGGGGFLANVRDLTEQSIAGTTRGEQPFSPTYELDYSREHPFGFVEPGITNGNVDPNVIVLWNFPVGSSDVSRFGIELSRYVPMMQRWLDLGDDIKIGGFASSSGSEALNLSLGRARALSVQRWLVEDAGLPVEKLETISFGESMPLPPGDYQGGLFSGERAARNRRVEILRNTREWDGSAYDHALAVVDGSPLPANQKKRLNGLLTHLKDARNDDLVFNRFQMPFLMAAWGELGYEWLRMPEMWAEGEPPLVGHLRDAVAASLHPGLADEELLAQLRAMDLGIVEGIEWIDDQVTRAEAAEGVPHVLVARVSDWIQAGQEDQGSVYYYYGAGQ